MAKVRHPGSSAGYALIFPNRREVGMANLGLDALYFVLTALGGAEGDFHYSDRPLGLLTSRKASDRDVLAFSLSFEGDYPAVVDFLLAEGLLPYSRDRDEKSPLVIAGGVAASLNPEPLAPFIDVFYLGEAEGSFHLLHSFIVENKGLRRKDFLRALAVAGLPGVYVPSAYEPDASGSPEPLWGAPRKVITQRAPADWEPARTLFPSEGGPFGGAWLIEVGRGCPHACRFCATGYASRPVRYSPASRLIPLILGQKPSPSRVGLVGAAVSNHPQFKEIARAVVESGKRLTVSSFRAESLDEEALELLARGGLKSLTVAVEAGSERLRRKIGKTLSNETLLRAAALAGAKKLRGLKIYAMAGLPGETDEDMRELVSLAAAAKRELGAGTVTLSLSSFVPKPHTPFQWERMESEKILTERIRLVKSLAGRQKGLSVSAESPKWSAVQGLLSRGGRHLAPLLAQGSEKIRWSEALRSPMSQEVLGPREERDAFPWDFIGGVPSRELLLLEKQKALSQKAPFTCPSAGCGICRACHLGKNN